VQARARYNSAVPGDAASDSGSSAPPAAAAPSATSAGQRARKIFDTAFVAACAGYVLTFAWRQTAHLFDRHFIEWDARVMALPAWRYHGSGLFPGDFVVDFVTTMNPPLLKLIYWVGTLFTDPFTVSKLIPFGLLALVAWQGFCLGRRAGGAVLGGAMAVLLLHNTMLWDRMVGGNARAFGFPMVVTFLRYACEGAEKRTLATLILGAAAYPSGFIVCAPAYGLTLLAPRPRLRPILRFAAAGLVSVLILGAAVWRVDPRFGRPTTLAQAATLPQMGPGSGQPFYPLPAAEPVITLVKSQLREPWGNATVPALQQWNDAHGRDLLWILLYVFVVLAGRRIFEIPPALGMFYIATLGAFLLVRALAYRLHLPERVLYYGWPPLFIAALIYFGGAAARRYRSRWAVSAIGALLVAVTLLFYGDGLPKGYGIWDWSGSDTPTVRFLGQLPKDKLIAAHLRTSTFIQCFALRRTLFSSPSNVQNYYGYAQEMERRIGDYYRAYYARDAETVRRFAAAYHVDYLVVDERDFGPKALELSRYHEPWTSLNARLLRETPPAKMFLAHTPASAVVFRDGATVVIDPTRL
jgi:hypothetical protein